LQIATALTATETPFGKTPKVQQQLVWEMAASLASLISILGVARDEIVQAIVANRTILRFLFFLITYASTSPELVADVLSALMSLSEDNLEFGQALVDDQETHCYNQLLKLKESGGLDAMLACGVLHNVYSSLQWHDNSPGLDNATDALLVPAIAKVLEQTTLSQGSDPADILQMAFEVLASVGADFQSALEKGNKNRGKKAKKAKTQVTDDIDDSDRMDMDEPMTDDVAQESGDDEEEEGEEEESDDEMDQDAMLEDLEAVTGADDDMDEDSSLNDLPTLRELIQKAAPQCIRWSQVNLDSDEAIAVQSHALSALNNIAWTISCFDFTDDENQGIYQAWGSVAKKIWSKVVGPILASDTADLKLATIVTSLAWATSRSLGGSTPLKGDEHRRFMTLYQAAKGLEEQERASGASEAGDQDPFQGLGVKCIGVLGQLARDPAPVELNRHVGVFLLTILSGLPASPAADVVEALNQLFDIYGEESYACDREVFWRDNFLKHLDEIRPKVKAMTKAIDKRQSGELRDRADEALLNLDRFLRYKRKNVPK
jgi:hypothetical protein